MSNLLIHQKTGEVIHIDFGVVFEQGKVRFRSLNNFYSKFVFLFLKFLFLPSA